MKIVKEKSEKAGFLLAEQVLEQLPTPVMAVNKDLQIIFMNAAGRDFLGKSREELRGKQCYDMFQSQHCNTPECCMKRPWKRINPIQPETKSMWEAIRFPSSILRRP